MKNMKRLQSIQRNFNETRPGGVQCIMRKRVSVRKLNDGYGFILCTEESNINVSRGMKTHWYPCDDLPTWFGDRRRAKRQMYKQMKLVIEETISDLKK